MVKGTPVLLLRRSVIRSKHESVLARKHNDGEGAYQPGGALPGPFRLARQPASVALQRGRSDRMPKGPRRTTDGMGESLRAILTRVNPEGLKALRMLALERDTTLQAVAIEAFNDVLKKHGKRPVVRNPLLE